jgi:hypothetical protein
MTATGTLWASGTPTTAGSTWTTTTNANGANDSAYAVFTNATNGATGTIRVSGYGAVTAVGGVAPASVDSVAVTIYSWEGTTSRWSGVTAQLYDGSTPLGTTQAVTLSATSSNSQVLTFTGVAAYSNLANLSVNIVATKSGGTSSTFNVDAVGIVVNYTPAAANTLTDGFYGSSIDTTKWSTASAAGLFAEANNELEVTSPATAIYAHMVSTGVFNLTGSSFSVQLKATGTTTARHNIFFVQMSDGSSNKLWWSTDDSSGTLQAFKQVAGVTAQVGSNLTGFSFPIYLRVREASGTIYWDYSQDGITWTNQTSVANPFAITAVITAIQEGADSTPGAQTISKWLYFGITAIAASDTGSGSDSAALAAQADEPGAGADSASLAVSVADTGSGADAATVQVLAPDTGAGTDTATVRAQAADGGSFFKANDFESGSNGTTITAANSAGNTEVAFDYAALVNSGTGSMKYDSASKFDGSLSFRSVTTVATLGTWLYYTVPVPAVSNSIWYRFYLNVDAAPGSTSTLLLFVGDSGAQWLVRMDSSRHIVVTTTGAANGTSTTVLATGTWYRIEAQLTFGSGAAQTTVRIYDASGTLLETVSSGSNGTGRFVTPASLNSIFGNVDGSVWSLNIDDVAVTDFGWCGASGTTFGVTEQASLGSQSADTGAGAGTASVSATVPGTDAAAGADSAALAAQASDTGTGDDSAVTSATAAATDSGAGADSAALAVLASDTGPGADAAQVAVLATEDSGAADDAGISLAAADDGAGADSAAALAMAPSADTASMADDAAVSATTEGTDTAAVADDSAAVSAIIPASDAGAGDDSGAALSAVASDAAGAGVDSASVAAAVPGDDFLAGDDLAVVGIPGVAVADDSGDLADLAAVSALAPGDDAGASADFAQALVNGEDSGVVLDDGSVALTAADDGTGADAAVIAVTGTDSGTGADSAAVSSAITDVTGEDTGTGTDLAVVRVIAGASDSGAWDDSAVAGAQAIASDTGNWASSAALAAGAAAADTGHGTDFATVRALAVAADSGAASELAMLIARAGDLGGGIESAITLAAASGHDYGICLEAATVLAAAVADDEGAMVDSAVVKSPSAGMMAMFT